MQRIYVRLRILTKMRILQVLLALHADEIYMVPNGTIGAAAVIDSAGNAADLKAHSAWVAQMEAAAESKGREPKYARAMADASVDLPEFRAGKGIY